MTERETSRLSRRELLAGCAGASLLPRCQQPTPPQAHGSFTGEVDSVEGFLGELNKTAGHEFATLDGTLAPKVICIAKDRPLREYASALAELFWLTETESKGKGGPQITLGRAKGAADFDRELYIAALDRAARAPLELQRRLDLIQRGEIAPSRVDSRNIEYLKSPATGAAMELLCSLSLTQRRSIADGHWESLSYAGTNNAQHHLIDTIAGDPRALAATFDSILNKLPAEQLQRDAEFRTEVARRVGITMGLFSDLRTLAPMSAFVGMGASMRGFAAFDTPDKLYDVPLRGCPYPNDARSNLGDRKAEVPGTTRIDAKLPPIVGSWAEVLPVLASAIGRPVISDDYPSCRDRPDALRVQPKIAGLPTNQALDEICKAYGMVWWTAGEWVIFRSRTWFVDQLYEPPIFAVTSLNNELIRSKRLTQVVLVRLSRLPLHQLQGLATIGQWIWYRSGHSSGGRFPAVIDVNRSWGLLRLFAALPSRLQQAALSEEGLPLESVPENVSDSVTREAYRHFLPDALRAGRLVWRAKGSAQVLNTPAGNLGVCSFSFSLNSGAATVACLIPFTTGEIKTLWQPFGKDRMGP